DDEALNAMVATDLSEYFGREHVFQLPVSAHRAADFLTRVPILFDSSATHEALLSRIEAGDEVSVVEQAEANGGGDRHAGLGPDGIAMFIVTPGKHLQILVSGDESKLEAGQELLGLIDSGATDPRGPGRSPP